MTVCAYSGRSLPLGEFHLITAERRTVDGQRVLEAFLFFPRARTPYQDVSFRFAWGSGGPRPELIADIDMGDAARQWALGLIDAEILNWLESHQPFAVPWDGARFEEVPAEAVVRALHVRRVQPDELRRIGYRSQDAEFRELVERIRQQPRLHAGPLDD